MTWWIWWLAALEKAPEALFLIHGEPTAQDALRVKLREKYGWSARLPQPMETVQVG